MKRIFLQKYKSNLFTSTQGQDKLAKLAQEKAQQQPECSLRTAGSALLAPDLPDSSAKYIPVAAELLVSIFLSVIVPLSGDCRPTFEFYS